MRDLRALADEWRRRADDPAEEDPKSITFRECADDLDEALTRFADSTVERLFDLGRPARPADTTPPAKTHQALTLDDRNREFLWSDKDGDVWRWDTSRDAWRYVRRGKDLAGDPTAEFVPYVRLEENRG